MNTIDFIVSIFIEMAIDNKGKQFSSILIVNAKYYWIVIMEVFVEFQSCHMFQIELALIEWNFLLHALF